MPTPGLEPPSDSGWFCPHLFDVGKGRFPETGKTVESATRYCVGKGESTSRDLFLLLNLRM